MSINYNELYNLFEFLAPLDVDCGRACAVDGEAACCAANGPDGENSGMRLFPGEEAALGLTAPENGVIPFPSGLRVVSRAQGNGSLLVCGGRCHRNLRPLACRFFPLYPRLTPEGSIQSVYDPRGWRLCPLVRFSGAIRLQIPFVRAVRRAGVLLAADPACREVLREQTAEIDEANRFLLLDRQRPPQCRRGRRTPSP